VLLLTSPECSPDPVGQGGGARFKPQDGGVRVSQREEIFYNNISQSVGSYIFINIKFKAFSRTFVKFKDPAQHSLRHESRLITVTTLIISIMRTIRLYKSSQTTSTERLYVAYLVALRNKKIKIKI